MLVLLRHAAKSLKGSKMPHQDTVQILREKIPPCEKSTMAQHHGEKRNPLGAPLLLKEWLKDSKISLGLLARRCLKANLHHRLWQRPYLPHILLHHGVTPRITEISDLSKQPDRRQSRIRLQTGLHIGLPWPNLTVSLAPRPQQGVSALVRYFLTVFRSIPNSLAMALIV